MDTPESQVCKKCHTKKPLDAFGTDNHRKSGKNIWCLECARAYNVRHLTSPKEVPHEKTCTKCGKTKPITDFGGDKYTKDGKATRCLDCKRDAQTQQRIAHPEMAGLRTAKWRQNHPDRHQASVEKGREKKNKRRRELHLEQKEKDNAQNAAWYEANKPARKVSMKAWDELHPNYPREKSHRRRSRLAQVEVMDLSSEQWEEIKAAFNHRCVYCPPDCVACKKKTHVLHQEHLEPVVKGGNYTVHNIVPACKRCNSKKGTGAVLQPVQPLLLTIAAPNPSQKKAV